MKRLLSWLDLQDSCILLAIVLIGVGAGLVYLPAGLIATGALVLALALWRM